MTRARTVPPELQRSPSILQMATRFTIWPAMSWRTSDWYRPDYYEQLATADGVVRNPQGPTSAYDPSEPNQPRKVHRSGSFLCTDQYCSRYMVGTRGKGEVSTGTNHLGFRCVVTGEQWGRRANVVPRPYQ
jgi:hypothetical protein